jgi:hypothetical protein
MEAGRLEVGRLEAGRARWTGNKEWVLLFKNTSSIYIYNLTPHAPPT